LIALPSLFSHDYPPQQVIQGPLRAGMDFGAVDGSATKSILNPRRLLFFVPRNLSC